MTLSRRPFTKMSGGGNDFVVFDNREGWFPREDAHERVARLCRRGLGVGADAVLLLEEDPETDFRMVYYNADGGEAPMCGNGAMCIARYARLEGILDVESMRFTTGSGVFRARVADPASPTVTLWLVPPRDLRLRFHDLERPPYLRVGFVDTSTPHVVALVDDVEGHDVVGEGARFRREPRWDPPGTNVDFISTRGRQRIRMRTFERGVEAETLSCGTGATASAILTCLWGLTEPPVEVETTGGIPLTVEFTPPAHAGTLPADPRLTGEARVIYRGELAEI
ncbi:MAG TPA: diaminopimelate epimerase [Gemmatimonadota bacterium]|nr:diaminopimelate epimerase [Gemmatimonadota bacterium]